MKRREQTYARRDQIIQAALSSFNELGYQKTTMADICRRSQASTGSIYHHFKGKEQLASEVYLAGIRHYQEGILEIVQRENRARQGIHAIVQYHLQWVVDHPEWARFLFQMRHAAFMVGTEEEFQRLNQRFGEGVTEWVMDKLKKKQLRGYPPDVFMSLLLGPCQEYTRQWLTGWTVTDHQTAGRYLADAVWNNLRATRPDD